jgi:hypothetical protein
LANRGRAGFAEQSKGQNPGVRSSSLRNPMHRGPAMRLLCGMLSLGALLAIGLGFHAGDNPIRLALLFVAIFIVGILFVGPRRTT